VAVVVEMERICCSLVCSNCCRQGKVATKNEWQVSKGHMTSLTHDLLSLLFGCHLTLYATIAAYKVAASHLPMLDNFKFCIKKKGGKSKN